jgi:anti-anti-sigma regulatory factor
MLKITIQRDERQTSFELEGRLAGPWVGELATCWRSSTGARQLRVNLKAVTFIDEAGRNLLSEMHRQGVTIEGKGCMTASIIEEILREDKS